MKKLLFIFISFLIISCTPKYILNEMDGKGDLMLRPMNGNYSIEQFDSMCVADTLPRSLDGWKFMGFKDYETNEKVYLYFYIKENGKNEVVYKLEKINNIDSIKIIKRIIIE